MAICFILNWSYDKTIDDLVFRLKSIELSLFDIMIKMDKLIELMKISWGWGMKILTNKNSLKTYLFFNSHCM